MYIYKGTKLLRCGYTTGTCAAAAAKAAAQMLLGGETVTHTDVMLPKGMTLTLAVKDAAFDSEYAQCCVIKDSGDDPDVTDGIAIYARVCRTDSGIVITGGEGIGKVTMPGLDRGVGEYAINTVPRKMITESVGEVSDKYGYTGGLHVTIYAPAGAETAKKTFNPRMGIVGGISIIGTTGIVEPMSDSAIIETIRAEANIRRQSGDSDLYLSVGNYSEQYIGANLPGLTGKCVMCSNFIGDALDIGVSLGFERILLIGHIGKLVKLGSGIMNTHSAYADGRMETLICCAALCGADRDVLEAIDRCVTVDAAFDILHEKGMAGTVADMLGRRIQHSMDERVKGCAVTGSLVFSFRHELMIQTGAAEDMLKNFRRET